MAAQRKVEKGKKGRENSRLQLYRTKEKSVMISSADANCIARGTTIARKRNPPSQKKKTGPDLSGESRTSLHRIASQNEREKKERKKESKHNI